jgi:hypothetical protein
MEPRSATLGRGWAGHHPTEEQPRRELTSNLGKKMTEQPALRRARSLLTSNDKSAQPVPLLSYLAPDHLRSMMLYIRFPLSLLIMKHLVYERGSK